MPRDYDDYDDDYDDRRPRRFRSERGYEYEDRPPGPSGVGVAAFVLALLAALIVLGMFGVAGAMAAQGRPMDEDDPETMMVGLGILSGLAIALVGLVLGIIACVLPHRNKILAIIGLTGSGLVLLGGIGLLCVGMLMA